MPSKGWWKDREKKRRTTIELDEDVKEYLRDMSQELGVSMSSIIQYFILTGSLDGIAKYLEKSNAPMWEHKLNLDRLKKDKGFK
jgi:hypothetical protein